MKRKHRKKCIKTRIHLDEDFLKKETLYQEENARETIENFI
jgi:hypothetical protein